MFVYHVSEENDKRIGYETKNLTVLNGLEIVLLGVPFEKELFFRFNCLKIPDRSSSLILSRSLFVHFHD